MSPLPKQSSAAEKESLLPQTEQPIPRPSPRRASVRYLVTALALLMGLFWLSGSWNCGHSYAARPEESNSKVPLEIHIMSKCPDARDCIEKLVVPTMANVSNKVDFKLSFIGKITDDGGVECKHGQTECVGNIIELCAAAMYPSPKIYLGFTRCLSLNYPQIPSRDLIEDCALQQGMSFDTLNDCASKDDGAYGMGLLKDSMKRSQDLGATTSCTVRLDGKKRCVRDGGEWNDCEGGSEPADLIKDIERLYGKRQLKVARGWPSLAGDW